MDRDICPVTTPDSSPQGTPLLAPYEGVSRLNRPLTVPIFHYTDRVGLVGIMSSKEMWATDALYLNDAAEVAYGQQVIARAVERRLTGPYGPHLRAIWQRCINEATALNLCLLSFSEVPDDLSQWRAYSHGGGFAIGLQPGAAIRFATANDRFFFPVCYDVLQQDAAADGLVRELEDRLAPFVRRALTEQELEEASRAFRAASLFLAVRLKHVKFRDEHEWRSVRLPMDRMRKFRATRTMVVPYTTLRLDADAIVLSELEVIVGPTAHPFHSRNVAIQMLTDASPDAQRKAWERVSVSEIPYRDW